MIYYKFIKLFNISVKYQSDIYVFNNLTLKHLLTADDELNNNFKFQIQ